MKIEMFTGPRCSYCEAAKALLKSKNLTFIENDIENPTIMEEFRRRLPRIKSIPQVFIDDIHVGGFEDLKLILDAKVDNE